MEWPPGAGRGGWRKLHIGVDPATGRVQAEELTRSRGPEAQRAEAALAVGALNRMAEIGMPKARRIA